ncbi:phosphorylase family protein [Fibrobacter intestinalis]|uniref:Futalosine hydrolase n=1 Tax=Fibrobacter intestinalis TaxID=28122 RepID=A0A1T4LLC5_9BACT|nr:MULTISPECIES: hypothetical protein [Fibrobacter]PBC73919.1 futalosine hydrolase [Fibrobacter sp. NR9]SJZ55529.1 futalosine hydrolase [Fibrobacter intestinalis]
MRTLRKTLLAVPSSVEWKVLFPKVPYENSVQKPFVLSSSLEAACVGVGLVGFASGFTQLLGSRQYAKAILVGIAGALPFSGLSSGTIVRVDAECVGDVGYWNDGVFSPFSKRPYCFKATSSKWAPPSIAQLSGVRGVSVNTMTSCEQVLEFRARFYKAQVEAMEGASAFAIAKALGIPVFEVRAISNFAGDRDVSGWNIKQSLQKVRKQIIDPMVEKF